MKGDSHKKHCTCLACHGTSGWTLARQWCWFFAIGNRRQIEKSAKQYRPEK